MSESILTILRQEHRKAGLMMDQIDSCRDLARKKELYLQLKEDLFLHMEGEEKTIYGHLKDDVGDEEAEDLAIHASEGHQEVKELFASLDNTGIESDEWDSTFRRLKEAFLQHVEEEESELFTEAKEDFSREELQDFADEFEDAKHHSTF